MKSHTLNGRSFPSWVNLVRIREIHRLRRVSNYSEISEARTNIHVGPIKVGKDTIPFVDFYVLKPFPLRDQVTLDGVTPKS